MEAPHGYMYVAWMSTRKRSATTRRMQAAAFLEGKIGATRLGTGPVDENTAGALDGGNGGDDLHRLSLRPSSAPRCSREGRTPGMLRGIAAAKQNNDRIDAGKISDITAQVAHPCSTACVVNQSIAHTWCVTLANLCRAGDRHHSPRVPGSCDRIQ